MGMGSAGAGASAQGELGAEPMALPEDMESFDSEGRCCLGSGSILFATEGLPDGNLCFGRFCVEFGCLWHGRPGEDYYVFVLEGAYF